MENEKVVFPSLQGLTSLQRGKIHKRFVWLIYFVLGVIGLYGFEWVEQKRLFSAARWWATTHNIAQSEFQKIMDFIATQGFHSFGPQFTYVLCVSVLIYGILKFVTKFDWAAPVTLKRAVHFSMQIDS